MKNNISSLIVGFVVFSLNSSISWGKYACEKGTYHGLKPYVKGQPQSVAVNVEGELYDELSFLNRALNVLLWNFQDHLLPLNEKSMLNLCKCVYTSMTGKPESTNSNDSVHKYPNMRLTIQKSRPGQFKLSQHLKLTQIECKINNLKFFISEGFRARFCINCYDIYVLIFPDFKTSEVPNGFFDNPDHPDNENVIYHSYDNNIIGRVEEVRFENLLVPN